VKENGAAAIHPEKLTSSQPPPPLIKEGAGDVARPAFRTDFTVPLKIVPVLITWAWTNGYGGAIRAWTLVRHLDEAGSGGMSVAALHDFLGVLNVHSRTARRWIKAAIRSGLLKPYRRSRSGERG